MTKVWAVWHYNYEQSAIQAVYDSENAADAHAAHEGESYGVEEYEVRSTAPTWTPYYHGMAQVGCMNPALDRQPFVETAGETDEWEPDTDERVATCPGNQLIGDDRSLGDAVWLSVFDMDRDRVLKRVTEKFDALLARRATESLPQWHELTQEEFAGR